MAAPRLSWFGLMVSPTRYNPRLAEGAERAGCYVFRSHRTKQILYVGSCSSAKQGLRSTVQRHVQKWRTHAREKTTHDPGVTFSRFAVEVALVPCAPGRALALEQALIKRLRPTRNVEQFTDDGEKVPF